VSSTVVMQDVFSELKFYRSAPNYLYLFQHCALKGVPEAVVEGMGGVWDRCATPGRHLSFEAGAQEAVVHWNAPRPWHAGCNDFLRSALTRHFRGNRWHFTHSSSAAHGRVEQSKVVRKYRGDGARLPSELWAKVRCCPYAARAPRTCTQSRLTTARDHRDAALLGLKDAAGPRTCRNRAGRTSISVHTAVAPPILPVRSALLLCQSPAHCTPHTCNDTETVISPHHRL